MKKEQDAVFQFSYPHGLLLIPFESIHLPSHESILLMRDHLNYFCNANYYSSCYRPFFINASYLKDASPTLFLSDNNKKKKSILNVSIIRSLYRENCMRFFDYKRYKNKQNWRLLQMNAYKNEYNFFDCKFIYIYNKFRIKVGDARQIHLH